MLCAGHQVLLAHHHRRVVSIPFTFSVFIWIVTTEDLLLMLSVLELRLRKHILEVLLLLLASADLRICLVSRIILVFDRWATHAVFSILRVSDRILSFIEGPTVVALRVLLHRYHRQISLYLNSFAHFSFWGCSGWQRRQCGVTCLNTGLMVGSAGTLSNRFSHRVDFLHGHIVVLFVGIRQRLVNH